MLSATLLMLATLTSSGPPMPPGMTLPQPTLTSPKANEFKASLGTPMLKTAALIQPRIIIGGFVITNISVNIMGGTTSLSWQNGVAPYQIWASPTLSGPWSTAGNSSLARAKTVPLGENQYWKLQAQAPSILTLNSNTQPRLVWNAPDTDMADSLGNFTVQISTDNGVNWVNIAQNAYGLGAGVYPPLASQYPQGKYQANDATDPALFPQGIKYRLKQTSANGVVVPYNIPRLGSTAVGSITSATIRGPLFSYLACALMPLSGDIVCVGTDYAILSPLQPPAPQNLIIDRYTKTGDVFTLVWSKVIYDGLPVPYCVAVDSVDNIIIGGTFAGTIDFGSGTGPLTGDGSYDAFIVKFNSVGDCEWRFAIQGTSLDMCLAVAVDSADNIYATGSFAGTVDFGGGYVFTSTGGNFDSDVWIAKYNSSSSILFATNFGTGDGIINGLQGAIGESGRSIYVNNYLGNDEIFVTGLLGNGGHQNIFVDKYNSSLVRQWRTQSTGIGPSNMGLGVITDADNNPVITGRFTRDIVIPDGGSGKTLTFAPWNNSTAASDMWVAKLDRATGNCVWANGYSGSLTSSSIFDQGTSITKITEGGLAVTGQISGTATFGTLTLNAGINDILVLKIDSNGTPVWVRNFGGAASDIGYSVTYLTAYGIIVSGQVYGVVDLGGFATNSTYQGAFLMTIQP